MSSQIILQVIIVGMGVFKDSSKRRLEYFNELILMMTMYTIICYSPWVQDVELKFYIGYVTIGFVILHLVINLFLIFRTTFIMLSNRCRRRMTMKTYKKSRSKLQKRLKDNHEKRLTRTKKLLQEGNEAKQLELEQKAEYDKDKQLPVIVEQCDEEQESESGSYS